MSNRRIMIGSAVLGIMILLTLAGSMFLWREQNIAPVNAPPTAPPPPTVVSASELSPDELIRLVLQMWYTRDFDGMYTLLDASLKANEPRDVFIARMEKLPRLTGIRVSNARRNPIDDQTTTVTLTIDAKTEKGRYTRDASFSFAKTDGQWKITTFPSLDT